ncbi:MAG: trypsin-like peptidase domain-containing protein [Ilumatobacteraceae bacterium]
MDEFRSAVAVTERPAYEPPSTSLFTPFPPPTTPPLFPPGEFDFATTPAPKRRRTRAAVVAIVVSVLVAVAAGVVVQSQRDGGSTAAPTSAPSVATPTTAVAQEPLPTVVAPLPVDTPLDTDSIVATVDPAVVDITTTIDGGEAAGTGMVLTPSGLVLTNNHVIAGATSISVQIAGSGPTYSAHIVGYDKVDDVAVIQLEGVSGLTTITPGDSAAAAIGDGVVTIGNALGAAGPHAVGSGSVTAVDQTITANDLTGDSESVDGLIQFDATIQPGDSGGPLVNTAGQVIGMNTAATVRDRRRLTSEEGYAIPIASALAVAQQIQDGTGSVTVHIGDRAILGVEVTAPRSVGQNGALVANVHADTPAAGAGIVSGDTIIAIDDVTISAVEDIGSALFPHSPADEVQVTWLDANGVSHSATAQLIAGPPA